MKKSSGQQNGFALVEALLIIVILLLIGFGGYYVWHNQHKDTSSAANLEPSVSKSQPSSSTQAPDPYAGWKTYTLKTEKLNFKYPSQWSISDSSHDTQDVVDFTAPDGSTFNVQDGQSNGGDNMPEAEDAAVPVKFAGNADYLVFLYGRGSVGAGSSDGRIMGAFLQTSTTRQDGYPFPADKYAVGPNDTTGAVDAKYFMIGYHTKSEVSLDAAKTTQMFHDAKLVIESMHY